MFAQKMAYIFRCQCICYYSFLLIFFFSIVILCVVMSDVACLQSGRDLYGAGIALFTAKLHQPADTTHQAVLKALIYLLDAALER